MNYQKVKDAVQSISNRISTRPKLAVILGSGLGGFADGIENQERISYDTIPGFPHSNVEGHAAQLVFGKIQGQDIVAMQGRFHFYEGFSMQQLVFPIFVLRMLGVEDIIVTNACGGINETFSPGDLMLITDHINMLGNNPLIGDNDERFGPRFPDMTETYSHVLLGYAERVARENELTVKHGVYALFSGPCYETAAEIRAYRVLGADAIGMSTVPEVIAAHYLGMRVLGIACITNMATGIAKTKHSHEEVLAVAERTGKKFCLLIEKLVAGWKNA